MSSSAQRNTLLKAAKKLKDAGEQYRRIFIKKDVNPVVRKELGRLKDAFAAERDKPENQGKLVAFDDKARQITVDGTIVDFYRPQYFPSRG